MIFGITLSEFLPVLLILLVVLVFFRGRRNTRLPPGPWAQFNSADSRILGTGNFGTVHKMIVKGVSVAVMFSHTNRIKEAFRSMLMEVKVLSYLGSHPNLIEFVGCYTKKIMNETIYIATKLCEGGTLESYLRRERLDTDEGVLVELVRFSLEIANGMEYISKQNFVHGDLATRNVRLDGDLTCKIGDFGLSRKLYEYAKYVKKNQEPLPWRWMAYESLEMMEFTTKSDVWSYGSIPYPGLTWTADFAENLRTGFWMCKPQFATDEIFEKMVSCWIINRDSRPSFLELHEYFLQQRNTMLYTEL